MEHCPPAALKAEADKLAESAWKQKCLERTHQTALSLKQQMLELVLDQLNTLYALRTHRQHQVELRNTARSVLAQAESTQSKVRSLEEDYQQLQEEQVTSLHVLMLNLKCRLLFWTELSLLGLPYQDTFGFSSQNIYPDTCM